MMSPYKNTQLHQVKHLHKYNSSSTALPLPYKEMLPKFSHLQYKDATGICLRTLTFDRIDLCPY